MDGFVDLDNIQDHINWFNKVYNTSLVLEIKAVSDVFPHIKGNSIIFNPHSGFVLFLYNCFYDDRKYKGLLLEIILIIKFLLYNRYAYAEKHIYLLEDRIDSLHAKKKVIEQTFNDIHLQYLFLLYHEFAHRAFRINEELKKKYISSVKEELEDYYKYKSKLINWPIRNKDIIRVINDERLLEEFACDLYSLNHIILFINQLNDESRISSVRKCGIPIFAIYHYKSFFSNLRRVYLKDKSFHLRNDALRTMVLHMKISWAVEEEIGDQLINAFNISFIKFNLAFTTDAFKYSNYYSVFREGANPLKNQFLINYCLNRLDDLESKLIKKLFKE